MDLQSYIKQRGDTYQTFGESVGVSRRAVQKWVTRERFPRPQQLARIVEVTNGEVTATDFLPSRVEEVVNADPV